MIPNSIMTTMQNAATGTGNGTNLVVADAAQATLQAIGTFSATVYVEGTIDGTNWHSLQAFKPAYGTSANYITATGIYLIPVAGYQLLRARIASYSSGSVTVIGVATAVTNGGFLNSAQTNAGDLYIACKNTQGNVYTLLGFRTDIDAQPTVAHMSTPAGIVQFNGTSWDRIRNNEPATLLASAARTATVQSADQTNYNSSGLILILDVSALADTPEITLSLQIKDPISGNYFTIWTAAAAVSATGTKAYLFTPGGAAGSYTEAVNLRLARTWRLNVAHADTDSITYSVAAINLL